MLELRSIASRIDVRMLTANIVTSSISILVHFSIEADPSAKITKNLHPSKITCYTVIVAWGTRCLPERLLEQINVDFKSWLHRYESTLPNMLH